MHQFIFTVLFPLNFYGDLNRYIKKEIYGADERVMYVYALLTNLPYEHQ